MFVGGVAGSKTTLELLHRTAVQGGPVRGLRGTVLRVCRQYLAGSADIALLPLIVLVTDKVPLNNTVVQLALSLNITGVNTHHETTFES